jgi:hypothetical protein
MYPIWYPVLIRNKFLGALTFSVALMAPAFSQNITGLITGTVQDPAGSVIPNANVTLTNQETRAALTLTSNERNPGLP